MVASKDNHVAQFHGYSIFYTLGIYPALWLVFVLNSVTVYGPTICLC